jgi:hypothetical protein
VPRPFSLRRCARALNRLGQATGLFVPLAPLLVEVLQWGDLSRAPKPAPGQQPDLLLQLRAGKAPLRSAAYQEEVISQVGARGDRRTFFRAILQFGSFGRPPLRGSFWDTASYPALPASPCSSPAMRPALLAP